MKSLSSTKNILSSTIRKIDDLIEKIPARHVKTIGQAFGGLVVLLAIAGAFWGMRAGGGAAGVKAPPLASSVRDVFEYDIHKANRDGNFDFLIESERMSGHENSAFDKITFPARESLDMEYEGGIVDYKHDKRPTAPEMEMNYQPLEGKYAEPIGRMEPQVSPLDRRQNPDTNISKSDIPKTDFSSISPLETDTDIPVAGPLKTEPENLDVPVNEKRIPGNQEQDFPKPITDGAGILE